jgi:uncharacterized membrane protein YqjE
VTTEPKFPRLGFVATIKNYLADALGATRTRVDHFTADVEHRLFRLLAMLMWSAIAFVCLSLGLFFAMATIIFGFHLPPKYAFGIPALVFLVVGAIAVLMFRFKKASKPKSAKKHRDE